MTTEDIALPESDDLAAALLDLTVPHEDIGELLALRGRMTADPGLRRELASAAERLVSAIGPIDGGWDAPLLDDPDRSDDRVVRYFPVYALVATLPYIRAHHRGRSVPEAVSRHTLADLGRHMALHRRVRGTGGLAHPGWLVLHFRGELYQLGRLQFQRSRLGERMGEGLRNLGEPYAPGDLTLDLHIPDFLGPLTPDACDRALAAADAFFARCHPEETYTTATCHSWLLDPQLAGVLPEGSNIRRFQERFSVHSERTEPADSSVVGFVFGDSGLAVDSLPRRTGLERAIGDHLRAGGHWYTGHGWFAR
ncbi:acyltransferase domain-containing protein [Streptomyces yaizuensis]|uniref:Acyltransferase domain-containing protein n=1 Tax=Streptomyces yaizuensis TaxID=2989713 RepID=A0ABQ5P7J7_9ACTN|nr:acyltransferase domain-containing protein [Streptomyces sp. YSPA8]GLF98565.1 acyltransferase domain-containing protein [Streptomyces sp. YSPA8]